MPLRNLSIILLAAVLSVVCYQKAQRDQYVSVLTEAMHLIHRNYVDQVESRSLFEGAMEGMVRGLDPYSAYISPREYRQFQEGIDQEFGGIGIVVELNPETKRLTVLSPVVGTPAYKAGMRAGDVILEIDGVDTEGMSLREAVALMRGQQGTPVHLVVLHAGEQEPVEFTIVRDIIHIESVLGDVRQEDGSWQFFLEEHPHIAYVRITTFGEHTLEDLRGALQLQDRPVEALILDLRDNAGGLLPAAVATCDMFLSGGRIVSTRGRNGQLLRKYDATSSTLLDPDIPMVVLTNRFSASASEIVAAALQDHNRAVVVGQRTWGKGTVQNILRLEGGASALKLTTATYWRPSEQDIHRRPDAGEDEDWGVRPTEGLEVKLTDEEREQVTTLRRQRDVVQNGNQNSNNSNAGPQDQDQPQPSLFQIDRQLQAAVEHLQEQLRDK